MSSKAIFLPFKTGPPGQLYHKTAWQLLGASPWLNEGEGAQSKSLATLACAVLLSIGQASLIWVVQFTVYPLEHQEDSKRLEM